MFARSAFVAGARYVAASAPKSRMAKFGAVGVVATSAGLAIHAVNQKTSECEGKSARLHCDRLSTRDAQLFSGEAALAGAALGGAAVGGFIGYWFQTQQTVKVTEKFEKYCMPRPCPAADHLPENAFAPQLLAAQDHGSLRQAWCGQGHAGPEDRRYTQLDLHRNRTN
jgi:hypothetical protein